MLSALGARLPPMLGRSLPPAACAGALPPADFLQIELVRTTAPVSTAAPFPFLLYARFFAHGDNHCSCGTYHKRRNSFPQNFRCADFCVPARTQPKPENKGKWRIGYFHLPGMDKRYCRQNVLGALALPIAIREKSFYGSAPVLPPIIYGGAPHLQTECRLRRPHSGPAT